MKLLKKVYVFLLAGMMALSSVNVMAAEEKTTQAAAEQQALGEVRLQDDFYTAVNSDWLKQAKFPLGYPCDNCGLDLTLKCDAEIEELLQELLAHQEDYKTGSPEKNIVTLYNNILNTKARDEQKIAPIRKDWKRIKDIASLEDMTKYLLYRGETKALFNIKVGTDVKDSNKYTVYLNSLSLILGDADYYNMPTDYSKNLEAETTQYLNTALQFYGYSKEEAAKKVDELYVYEKMMAKGCVGRQEASKYDNVYDIVYNPYTLDELGKAAPHVPFAALIEGSGLKGVDQVIVYEPKWLKAFDALYTEKNVEMMKNAIEIHFLIDQMAILSTQQQSANDDYLNKINGIDESVPMDQQALTTVQNIFTDDIGKLYVQKYFSEASKKDVEELVQEIISKYKEKIAAVDWMTEETKKNAIEKLDKMKIKIGYPDKWETYDGLALRTYEEGGSLYENFKALEKWSWQKQLDEFNNPVDKSKFLMPCQTVNACYQPSCNDITFPAGILQPPYYDINRKREANMGAIGVIIGHEISHAFDTAGANFDAEGNMNTWWTKEDYDKFAERTSKVRAYFSNIVTDSGEKVNGDLTVGENVADITSMSCMLDILRDMDDPDYDAFFRAWAVSMREIMTPEYEQWRLNEDPHSPSKVRVNDILSQFQEFYDTYGIKEGDALYVKPGDRLKIY